MFSATRMENVLFLFEWVGCNALITYLVCTGRRHRNRRVSICCRRDSGHCRGYLVVVHGGGHRCRHCRRRDRQGCRCCRVVGVGAGMAFVLSTVGNKDIVIVGGCCAWRRHRHMHPHQHRLCRRLLHRSRS